MSRHNSRENLNFVEGSEVATTDNKLVIAKRWFEKPENLNLESLKDFAASLNQAEIDDLVTTLFSGSNANLNLQSPEQIRLFKGAISLLGDEGKKYKIILNCLTDCENTLANRFDLKTEEGLKLFKEITYLIKDYQSEGESNRRINVLTSYLWIQNDDLDKRFENFITLAQEDFFAGRYNYREIFYAYMICGIGSDKHIDLCMQLYPEAEVCRLDIFENILKYPDIAFRAEDKERVKKFIQEITDPSEAMYFTEVLSNPPEASHLKFTESDILDMSSQRLGIQYQSVADVLKRPLIDGADAAIKGSLNEEGIEEIKRKFGEDALTQRSLADIFAYYDIKNEITSFKKLVKTEVLQEIVNGYLPTETRSYISFKDYEKLNTLFDGVLPREVMDRDFPLIKPLTSYLQSRSKKIPDLTEEDVKNYQINFQTFGSDKEAMNLDLESLSQLQLKIFRDLGVNQKAIISQKDQEEFENLNTFNRQLKIRSVFEGLIAEQKNFGLKQDAIKKSLEDQRDKAEEVFEEIRKIEVPRIFKQLLEKKNVTVYVKREVPNGESEEARVIREAQESPKIAKTAAAAEDVAYFFAMATNPDSEIKQENKTKLLGFFQENKKELAYLFQTPDGLNNFTGVMGSLGDGCVANIATQCKIALYQKLITDPCDQILYSTFYNGVATPIVNNTRGDSLGGSANADILDNYTINYSHRLSPTGFLKSLKEEFYKNGKPTAIKSWEFIINEISEPRRQILLKDLAQSGVENPDMDLVSKIVNQKYGKSLAEVFVDQGLESPENTAEMAAFLVLKKIQNRANDVSYAGFDILESKYLKDFQKCQISLLGKAEAMISPSERNSEISEYLQLSNHPPIPNQILRPRLNSYSLNSSGPDPSPLTRLSAAARRFGGLTASLLSQARRRPSRLFSAIEEGRRSDEDHEDDGHNNGSGGAVR